jgi:hypothetical protein
MPLRRYGAASRPENDVSTSGGAIDTACVLDITQMASTGTLEAVSTSAADTNTGPSSALNTGSGSSLGRMGLARPW